MAEDPFKLLPDLAAEVTIPADGIVSRTVYQNDHLKAVLFGFSPGQELSEHTAAMPAIMHFLQGEARITLGGTPGGASAGTWVHMPPHLAHSIVAETPVTMLLLLVKSGKVAAATAAPAPVAGGKA